ncbi:MAG: hypothetical protein IT518_10730 [Burkholderiales bacterium]|nr:hypothetical protein [Burkholderiales bacterium]
MGWFDRFGKDAAASGADEQAIARYRYLVRTAPPEAIEQAHAEAFAQLTPEQRRRLLDEFAGTMSAAERGAALRAGDAPGALARVATRAELREPGSTERAWNRMGAAPGMGFGGMFGSSLLGSLAGSVLGTVIANRFFDQHPEASSLSGSGGELTDDPWQKLPDSDSADLAGDPGDFDSGSFDV